MPSQMLLDSIVNWEKIEAPRTLFHGCHAEDVGINTKDASISGNKWFSIDPYYAGEYCWHFSRPEVGRRFRAEVALSDEVIGILRPENLNGERFPYFLKECFPEVPAGYALSKHFQDVIQQHLDIIYPDIPVCYISGGGSEVLIPSCELYIEVVEFTEMPNSKSEYAEMYKG